MTYSHMLPHDREQLGFAQQIAGVLWNHLQILGALGLGSIVHLFAMRPKNGALIVSALSAPWLLSTLAMRTHVAVHEFELLIAAPVTALALAWLATADLRVFPSRLAVVKTGGICILALVQLAVLPALRPTGHADFSSDQLIRYELETKNSTQPGSIVMAPFESSVPIFYPERHIVRGISRDTALSVALPKIRSEFRDSTIYLAIPPSLAGRFTRNGCEVE